MTWPIYQRQRRAEAALRVREERERDAAFAKQQRNRNMKRTKSPQGDVFKADLDHAELTEGIKSAQDAADEALEAMARAQKREADLARMRRENAEANAPRFKASAGEPR